MGVCMHAYCRRIPGTDGSGALHTHVEALLMPAHCVAHRVCVLLWVCYSLRRPGLALRPLMVSEREAPADREPGLTREHPRQLTTEEMAFCVFMAFFFVVFCEVAAQLTHCLLYCLIKDAFILLKVQFNTV